MGKNRIDLEQLSIRFVELNDPTVPCRAAFKSREAEQMIILKALDSDDMPWPGEEGTKRMHDNIEKAYFGSAGEVMVRYFESVKGDSWIAREQVGKRGHTQLIAPELRNKLYSKVFDVSKDYFVFNTTVHIGDFKALAKSGVMTAEQWLWFSYLASKAWELEQFRDIKMVIAEAADRARMKLPPEELRQLMAKFRLDQDMYPHFCLEEHFKASR